MATNRGTTQEKKLEQLKEEEGEEEEEEEEIEALSLCDLPVNLINEAQPKPKPDSQIIETQDDFDFRLWGAPYSSESEMCAADEVFFQGQILPLRLSLKRCESRSESLDNGSLREFRSNSSRSSSIRSQNSTSSSSSTTTTTTPRISKPRAQNQNHFHTRPSPQPQLKVTVPRQTSFGNQGRKSSAWDFFRLGVVPAPEIALQDLKVRSTNGVNKNLVGPNLSSNNSSSNSNLNANSAVKRSYSGKGNQVFKQFVIGGSFWSGCKCSVETVQSDMVMIKGGTKSGNKTESATHAMKEKVVEMKKQKHRQKQGKRTMSRRRTFEWIKELSHDASYPDDEALLSKS